MGTNPMPDSRLTTWNPIQAPLQACLITAPTGAASDGPNYMITDYKKEL